MLQIYVHILKKIKYTENHISLKGSVLVLLYPTFKEVLSELPKFYYHHIKACPPHIQALTLTPVYVHTCILYNTFVSFPIKNPGLKTCTCKFL